MNRINETIWKGCYIIDVVPPMPTLVAKKLIWLLGVYKNKESLMPVERPV
jgi:hypothetical protein